MSAPFFFDYIKYVFVEEFSEVFPCNTYVDVVVYLYGNTDTVAFSDTEAAGKHYVVRKGMLLYCFFQKLYYILRALEMAGGSDTDLNEYHVFNSLSVKVT